MRQAWQAIAMGSMMVLGIGVFSAALEAAPLTLTRDGQPAAAIVLAEKPTKAAQFAAFELQWHIKAISGATLPIERQTPDAGRLTPDSGPTKNGKVRIYVGDTQAARALGLTQEAFKLQEYAVRSGKNEIVLAGKDADDQAEVKYDLYALNDGNKNANWPGFWEEQGTLHAVYDFLQDGCGVRWFNPTDTGALIPRQQTLTVKAMDLRRAPTFRYRDTGIGNAETYDGSISLWATAGQKFKEEALKTWEAAAYADSRGRQGSSWLVKRMQATLFLLRMRNGGEMCRANHSMYHYYELFWQPSKDPAAAKYFMGRKPELFAQGYKDDPPPQMCYTSTGLIAQVTREACDYLANGGYPYKVALCTAPLGAKWGKNYFCIEPMDNASFCKCPACEVLIARGTNYGAGKFFSQGIHSDYMFNFVNEVAKEVKKVHPDKNIVTLAYGTHAWIPKEVKLDPYLAVQFCFSTDSWPWYRVEYEHEQRLVREWGAEAKASGRPLYAWCYLGHLARAFAFFGNYNGFPGCFAHSIDKEFKVYKKLGYRGMFHCGLPMEVDAYVMFRLMDNADLKVDALLDEYFTGLYGAAGAPLKKFYLDMESVFCDPKVRQDQIPNGGTAQEIDWKYLGTPERMAEYAKLMESARRLAGTEREKRNVELFDLAIWKYMIQGRAQYELRTWWQHPDRSMQLTIPMCRPAPGGDPLQANFTNALAITNWLAETGSPTTRKLEARLVHDGRFLYGEFLDRSTNASSKDAWEMVFALRREFPLHRLRMNPDGKCQASLYGGTAAWESGAMAKPAPSAAGTSVLRMAIPLKSLIGGGVEAGWCFFGNVARVAGDGANAVWLPTIIGAEPVDWLGIFNLSTGDGAIPPEAENLSAAAINDHSSPKETIKTNAPGITLRTVSPYHLTMAADDLLQGKPMSVEPAGVYWHHQGRTQAKEDLMLLSDALTPRTPTEDMFSEGAPEIFLTWALGKALPEGQVLRIIRLTWSLSDPARSAVRVKFAVRNAKTQAWSDITDYVEVSGVFAGDNYYGMLEIDVANKNIAGFDAFRMTDGLGKYNTRFVELDAIAGPPQ